MCLNKYGIKGAAAVFIIQIKCATFPGKGGEIKFQEKLMGQAKYFEQKGGEKFAKK